MVFDSLFQKMSQNLPVYLQRCPPSLPKMKLPVWCPIWNPLPPQNETANRVPNSKPPSLPKMKLPIGCPIWNPLKHEYYRFLSIHVYFNLPKIGRQCTPPPQNEKVGYRSKWHFGSGWCTPPSRNWNWTKHECYRKKIISREVIKYILPIYPPPPLPLSDSMPEQETGEFQFQMDIWTQTPSTTPLQPKK